MGGTVSKALGVAKSAGAIKEVAPQPSRPAEGARPTSTADEDTAARRRARRGGRALLSDIRLNPEQGVGQSTLGAGPMQ